MKKTLVLMVGLVAIVGFMVGCEFDINPGGGGGGGGGYATLYIDNYSNRTIYAVYVSPTSSGYWGSNQLNWTIPPGTSASISNIPSGNYDLRAEGSGGAYWEEYSVYIGSSFTWSLYNKKGGFEDCVLSPDTSAALPGVYEELFNAEVGGEAKVK